MKYDINSAAGKLGLDGKTLTQHINSFYKEFQSNQNRISEILISDDFDRIYFEFHRLKSTFKMISAVHAESICLECCDLSREKTQYDYSSAFEKVRNLIENIHNQVNGVLN